MNLTFLLIIGYLMGAIPTGYWVVKALKGIDLLEVGSGSTGTTNVLRNAGKGAAIFVFIADILKGFLPVWATIYAGDHGWLSDLPTPAIPWAPVAVALVALIGHSKSLFLKFKGGKSAATGLGTLLALNWLTGLCTFAVFLTVLFVGRIVSVSSIIAVISCGVFMYLFHSPISYVVYCAIGAFYVTLRHKDNIRRLMAGTEPRIGQKLEDAAKQETEQKDDADQKSESFS